MKLDLTLCAMMIYPAKAPWLLRIIYPQAIWRLPEAGRKVYLTFDDGPHPEVTPFVLDQLQCYEAKATFFCIGQNVVSHPDIYQRLILEGHRVGNHTMQHRNGWNTPTAEYIRDIADAAAVIDSDLFRPPYGRITMRQIRGMRDQLPGLKLVFWDILSGDFDTNITAARCVQNVWRHCRPGSLIVFHDSEKAFPRLRGALPVILKELKKSQYEFGVL